MTDNKTTPSLPETTVEFKKHRGRPKSTNFLTWEECREFVQGELLSSKGKFDEWWLRNKPKAIPRFPYRVYTDEWTNWNDFLGNSNKFNERAGVKWRPMADAVIWAHTLKLDTYEQWMSYVKTQDVPNDIPKRPDLTYAGWISWGHWLGNKPAERIEVAKQAARNQIYYLIHDIGVPENVITYGIEPMGISGMKERYSRGDMTIVKLFWYDPEKSATIRHVVETLSSPYMDNRSQRITPNVYQIIEVLQYHLDTITKV